MNISRLVVLGLLFANGPMHGHRIRREAEITNVQSWGGVNVGALYREMHRMEDEGLLAAVRSEQEGKRPARVVYAISEEGVRELARLRGEAWRSADGYLDPVSAALLFGGPASPAELAEHLAYRRQLLQASLDNLVSERTRFTPHLPMLAIAAYKRGELRLAAELEWHEQMERILIEEAAEAEGSPDSQRPDPERPARQSPESPNPRGEVT
jgi:DNA-binding PadR family transcriptional regulator